MPRISARTAKRASPLSGTAIHKVMRRLFPKQNDYGVGSFEELVPELARFGVRTTGQFERLMKRHRRRLLEIDREPLDSYHIKYYSKDLGASHVRDAMRRNYWFAYPALVRIAAELQWGDQAAVRGDSEI